MEYYKFNRDAYNKWCLDNGDNTLRINYDLNENSIVIDAGGYKGDWSEVISKKYDPTIFIFEPIETYYLYLLEKFSNNRKIHIIHGGLAEEDRESIIYHSNDASSIFDEEGTTSNKSSERIKLFSLFKFMKEENIGHIDLLKINIEGGEYDLLEDIINKGISNKISDIQVQFHTFIPLCKERKDSIRKDLQKTHLLTYDYEFIWENWELKSN